MKVKFYYGYPLSIDIDAEKDVEVYIDRCPIEDVPVGSIRIAVIQEPYNDSLLSSLRTHPNSYTHLLTYYEDVLKSYPRAILFMGMSCWVTGQVSKEKKFSVSALVGGKANSAMPGYALRRDLWRSQDLITIPKDFYLSGEYRWTEINYEGRKFLEGSIVPFSKMPLFESQYHIVIENISTPNMFTEKLIDCFQTKTVPIYYGAPNIGNWFDDSAIIQVRSLQEIISVCNKLTPETYERLLAVVDDNYETSHKYCVYDEQLKEAILKLI